jgi:heme-degrading monooxygenase HmoA
VYYAVTERHVRSTRVANYIAAFRQQVETWAHQHRNSLLRATAIQGAASPGEDDALPVIVLTRWQSAAAFTDAYCSQPSGQWMDVVRQVTEPLPLFQGYRPIFEKNAFQHAAQVAAVTFLSADAGMAPAMERWARQLAARLATVEGVVGFQLLKTLDHVEEYVVVTEYQDSSILEVVESDEKNPAPPVPADRQRRVSGLLRYRWIPLEQLVHSS